MNSTITNDMGPLEKYWPETINYYLGSIYGSIFNSANNHPNLIALDYFDNNISYRKLIDKIDLFADALIGFGVKKGEYVTICMPNTPEAIYLIYAVNKIGAISNIIHPLNKAEEIQFSIDLVKSQYLFFSETSFSECLNVKCPFKIVLDISESMPLYLKLLYRIKNMKSLKKDVSFISLNQFLKHAKNVKENYQESKADEPSVVIYSGGTTGDSKGILLSNLCFNSIASQCEAVCRQAKKGNTILSALPIFHGFGLGVCVHAPLSLGLKCLLMPKISMTTINKTIKKSKINLLPVIPSMLNRIINNPSEGKDSMKSVEVILSGGDYLSDDLRNSALTYFKENGSSTDVQIGYGLSEATAFISATSPDPKTISTIGLPNPDNEIKIVNPNNYRNCKANQIGEIWVNGPSVMLGYVNNEVETDNVIKVDKNGKRWLRTGDLGYKDDDGILHYSSRLKRMIISNGYNIYPNVLENIISKCQYVENVVVVGIKDKIKQEVAKAVIVLKEKYQASEEILNDIKEYCKNNIAKYEMPKAFEFVKNLPITKLGKINYRLLQKKENENKQD